MKPFSIQPYRDEHQQGVIHLILPIQQIEFGVPVTIHDQPDLLIIPEFYQQNKGNFWVALHHQDLVGSIGLIDIGHQAAAIRKMFVRADFRGKETGLGQALLDTATRWCQHNGIHDIYLGTVQQLKAAQRFYEKNDFRKIAAEDLPAYFPRMKVDTDFYTRNLIKPS
ncbi:GNAT family N-acetyltransferase [Flavihumibacter sp. CACIAM 22H1]|uniref:GNAT family N-acetyltransferase n=1 Tax=Flavihumibacter sp. CACIAM 22H1 TaxID=1812911 RepID=UPI0007A892D9|nr:GNAT family N-acetyltransferase [Flavihumibacter sp. CACIAM 22H1]KYP16310.1 MAG: GNAT family acetyltransferase [Flavihumibacter sp. CACIAM 22H1]